MKEMKHTKSYLLLCFLSFLFLSVACSKDPSSESGGDKGSSDVPVSEVTVSPSAITLAEGESSQLSVSVKPSDASDKSVTWKSSNSSVVSVDASGKVTALKSGTSTVTATSKSGGKSGSCTVTVNSKTSELESISLNKHEITLEKGGNEVLEVTFSPSNATHGSVTWVSSDTKVVTVVDGIVVAVAPGTTEIIAKSGNCTDKCKVTVVISTTGIALDKYEITLTKGETAKLVATVTPSDSTDPIEWSSSDEKIVTVNDGQILAKSAGSAEVIVKSGNCTDKCHVTVYSGSINGYYYVDLGLSVKWATCNVGAEKPEDYGDYFAWGETTTKTDYSWSTYFDNPSGDGETFTKYATDKKTQLDLTDDAARKNWGGTWRMPTDAQWTELRKKCTWTWTGDYEGTGVAGRIVTSNVSGYEGNSIFLPAAGDRYGTRLYNAGSYGVYWSSSLYTGRSDYAYYVYLYYGYVYRKYNSRFDGYSVRPVSE